MPPASSLFAFPPLALAVLAALHSASTAGAMRSALLPGETTATVPVPIPAAADAGVKAVGRMLRAPLIAAGSGNPGVIAGALTARLKEDGAAHFAIMGHASAYTALKSVVYANMYIADALPGQVLAVVPSKQEMKSNTGLERMGYLLEVRPVEEIADAGDPDAISSGETNPGGLAIFMSQRLKEHRRVTVSAMGSKASYNVVKATAYAQEMLALDPEAGAWKFALVPSVEEFEKDGEKLSHMRLTCVRLSS